MKETDNVDVVVEIPKGSRNKYEFDRPPARRPARAGSR